MSISLTGLASGLDTGALIDGLVQAERQPIVQMQQRQKGLDQAKQTLSGFAAKIATLQSAIEALADPVQFASFVSTSSDPAIAVSTSGATTPGRHTVSVSQLAQESRIRSDAQPSATVALNLAGSLDISINGTTTSVSVAATDTLADIATKIRTSGARVTASVLYDGTNYNLIVSGLDTGAANAVSMTENGFSLGLTKPSNVVQSAQDAKLEVDGISITRPTNSVSGVIPGVTLALANKTTSPATIDTSTDTAGLQKKIQAFVTAYNDVVTAGHQAAGYGSTKPSNTELAGDSAIRSVLLRLSSMVASAIPNTIGKYSTLASVGVSSTRDGTLTLDANKLSAALADDPAAVAHVFVNDPQNASTGIMKTMDDATKTFIGGPSSSVQARMDAIASRSRRMADQMTQMQSHVDALEARLKAQFAAMEKQVSQFKSWGDALLGAINNTSNSSGGK
jgi:flagellar hook-associated protein 2